jgi:hypothetical protein
MLRAIEPRKPTSEPLVEISLTDDGGDGDFVPSGRRFADAPRPDGLNGYGLSDVENVAYQNACDRLRHLADLRFSDSELSTAMAAAGITLASPIEERELVVARYRREHGLPSAFHQLPAGDPSSNYEAVSPRPVNTSVPLSNASQLTTAAPAPSASADTHVVVPNNHVDFLHQLLVAVEPGAEQVAVSAFKVAFQKVFGRADAEAPK